MKVFSTKKELQKEMEQIRKEGKTVGFVPTMGALHEGHLSLINRSVAENDVTAVSIFVNPTQFNNRSDLEKYPRDLQHDLSLLEKNGCDIVFSPSVDEMYDKNEFESVFEFDFGGLDQVMEGKFRPGHFNGVVQVVSKLFNLVQPTKAYFGEKDFQQLAIIRRMVNLMNFDIEIVGCPIVREKDGLAMSSRNLRLNAEERQKAVEISKTLFESKKLISNFSPEQVQNWVIARLNSFSGLEVEYFEIVHQTTLQPIHSRSEPAIGCIAVFCGEVRLIDNIKYNDVQ
ncbi:MAG TPA: pantoate--beta-alanine ligase [Paludibacteraceae bacterium]|nr:pantoate--beta-alanine ligase [Paludibacteraceae bacterium]